MKIVHICLATFFIDNYTYQENMLPKFHKKLGLDVAVIAGLRSFDENGKGYFIKHGNRYINEYQIPVTRVDIKSPKMFYKKLKRFKGVYKELESLHPDILFIHGCQFMDMNVIVKYLKKHKEVTVYVDNHADFSNSASNWFSKNILHKILWRHSAKIIEPFTTKFYGVLPVRVDWLINMYGLPKDKCELLVMGADDEAVEEALKLEAIKEIRGKYGIADDDFLVVTGGKIDTFKLQTLLLMEAVRRIKNDKVRLIVFGSVDKEIKNKIDSLCDGKKVQYIGWAEGDQSYKYFASADLVVFPGRHSVYWEQVAGLGIPMICKWWDGTDHVDIGGNVKFLHKDSVEEIQFCIEELLSNPNIYQEMKRIAQGEGKKKFSYMDISKRAISCSL